LPRFEGAKTYTLRQADLKNALKKTSYAISTDETRYVLNGVLCAFKDNKLTLVATDGRRLALVDLELEIPPVNEISVIIPSKAISELQRLLLDVGDIELRLGENQVAFELNGTLLVSKLIPTETKERIELERGIFLDAVHRVSLLTSEKSNSIKLIFTKNNIDIAANSPEIGEARESLAVKYTGKDFTIAFNPEFLMAPLKNLSDDTVYLDLIDEMSPGVIKIKSSFLYVLMPMRISY
jgi:DNA polymerase-3 subunit beta